MNSKTGENPASLWSRRAAWSDTIVIGGLLLLANSLLSPADIGWVGLHPTPYLLMPILIGGRYGFIPGVIAGAAGSALGAGGHWFLNPSTLKPALSEHAFMLLALPFVGGICGQIQRAFRVQLVQAGVRIESMEERLKRLDTDIYLLREAKGELERLIATKDSEVSTLDGEIRRLFDSEGEELFTSVLLLLNRQTRIMDAALYAVGENGTLERKALIGASDHLPASIPRGGLEIVDLALKHKTSVSIPEFWRKTGSAPEEHLIAAPLLDSSGSVLGVILVAGMPFIALTKKTVHVIMLVCRWAARVIELRNRSSGSYRIVEGFENQKIFTETSFRNNLALSFESYRDHGLPSSVVIFSIPGDSKKDQAAFEKLVMQSVRGGDFPTVLQQSRANLAILLPLSGERGANVFINRILLHCKKHELCSSITSRLLLFNDFKDADQLWKELNRE